MKRTLINQIARSALLVPMCLIAFSFVSCSGDDDDDDSSSVSTADDGYTASGKISGHYYVDLGLSVKWATCNIGADSPEDYGNYYAWGETETKDSYTGSNSVTFGVEMDDIASNADYDAATANWGSSWRMPTYDEMQELVDNCTWEWTTLNDVDGYLVTGSNANSIFLPAAGCITGTSFDAVGSYGGYWTSTPDSSNAHCFAYALASYSNSHDVFGANRNSGRPVRPVSE